MLNKIKNKQKILYSKINDPKLETQRSDQLWASSLEFDESWKKRISVMASYIDSPGVVADFGCGLMWLEQFLKPENNYIPIDYIRRDERTIVVDLNKEPIPKTNANIAFLSGVLEYIKEPVQFVNQLTNIGFSQIILSYCTIEKFNELTKRNQLNWKSHESIFDLLYLFTSRYYLTKIDDINNNTILVFRKK